MSARCNYTSECVDRSDEDKCQRIEVSCTLKPVFGTGLQKSSLKVEWQTLRGLKMTIEIKNLKKKLYHVNQHQKY